MNERHHVLTTEMMMLPLWVPGQPLRHTMNLACTNVAERATPLLAHTHSCMILGSLLNNTECNDVTKSGLDFIKVQICGISCIPGRNSRTVLMDLSWTS